MNNILEKLLSPQAIKVYRVIGSHKPGLTAKQIGQKLEVFPNAVYREIKKLEDLGLVFRKNKSPVNYQIKNPETATDFIFEQIKQNLFQNQGLKTESPKITFFETRKQLLDLVKADTQKTKMSLNMIVSGHEVPAEIILSQKQAADRGVKVKILIQDLNASGKERIRAWQKMGIEIRYLKYLQVRTFVFDKKIVYFTSYSERKNYEAVGMRFEYEPYAILMDELFEQKWRSAKDIEAIKW